MLGLAIGTGDVPAGHALSLCLGYCGASPANYLPFLGASSARWGLSAIVHFDSFYYAMLAPIAYQLLSALEGQFLTRMLLGARLQLNAVAVFLHGDLLDLALGHSGALMAVRILALIKVICDHVPLSPRSADPERVCD